MTTKQSNQQTRTKDAQHRMEETDASTVVDILTSGDDTATMNESSSVDLPSTTTDDPTPLKRRRVNYQQSTTAAITDEENKSELSISHADPQLSPPMKESIITTTSPTGIIDGQITTSAVQQEKVVHPFTSTFNHQTTFADAMVEPCMVVMLEFISGSDRIQFMRISRVWSHMVRLPRLWTKFLLRLPYRLEHLLPNTYDVLDTDGLPDWFRNCIIRLDIYLDHPSHVKRLQHFHHIRHLSLDTTKWDGLKNKHIPLFRSALQSLHLVTFNCSGLSHPLMRCVFAPPSDSNQLQPPLIQHWAKTLTHLGIRNLPHESNQSTLAGISQCTWPQLTSLYLGSLLVDIDLILILANMLTQSRFPALQSLSVFTHSDPDKQDEAKLIGPFDSLFVSIKRELTQLVTLKAEVQLADYDENIPIYSKTVYYQVRQFPPNLIHLDLTLTEIEVDPSIGALRHLETLALRYAQQEVLTSSHQFLTIIGHHNLPQLHTLRIKSMGGDEMFHADWKHHHDDVIRMVKEMVSLTSLQVDFAQSWSRYPIISDWVSSIHHFHNLTELKCAMLPSVRVMGLYEAISLAPRLEDVTIKLPPPDLGRLVQAWSRRSSTPAPNLNEENSIIIKRERSDVEITATGQGEADVRRGVI